MEFCCRHWAITAFLSFDAGKKRLAPTRKFLALQKDWARVRTLGDGLLSNISGLTHQDLTFTALFKYEYLQE